VGWFGVGYGEGQGGGLTAAAEGGQQSGGCDTLGGLRAVMLDFRVPVPQRAGGRG
jgi:hypothetical protein